MGTAVRPEDIPFPLTPIQSDRGIVTLFSPGGDEMVRSSWMPSEPTTYAGYPFPAEVIHHATWLHHLFSLSLRDVELILAEAGGHLAHGRGVPED
jgi:hypothetical protein